MRNRSFFFGVLLLVQGVFGVEKYDVTMSVMEGDSVTLNPGVTKIPEDDTIQWLFDGKIIAHMNKGANIISTSEGDDAGFKDRLKLDKQTGSLIITNINTTDSGSYKLLIKSTTETSKTFKVTVHDDVKQLFLMEGDQVTLDTYFIQIQKDDQINGGLEQVNGLNSAADSRWSNIDLNDQTGDLTIRNIRRDQSGVYEVEIKNRDNSLILHKKFHITLSGVEKYLTVMEGNSVPLNPGDTKIPEDDTIQWLFGNKIIARMNKGANIISTSEGDNAGFKDRLKLDKQTGSLTITDIRTTDSGLYKLLIKSTTETYMTFKVTVHVSDLYSEKVLTNQKTLIGIIVFLVLLLVVAAIAGFVIYWKKYRQPGPNRASPDERNGLAKGSGETSHNSS